MADRLDPGARAWLAQVLDELGYRLGSGGPYEGGPLASVTVLV